MNKKTITLYAVLFCAIIIIIVVLFSAVMRQQNKKGVDIVPEPTIFTVQPTQVPNVYKKNDSDNIINRVENRQTLSPSDDQVKQSIISTKNPREDTIFSTENFKVDYVNPPDVFQVEILTSDSETAKNEAVNWFYTQGFSSQALCNLPVQFYLTGTVLQEYKAQNKSFSEVAPGC